VGEVEAGYVKAGPDEVAKDWLGVGGRTEGGDNLGAPLEDGIVKAEISGGHQEYSHKFIKTR
jgi:hypothetical protein